VCESNDWDFREAGSGFEAGRLAREGDPVPFGVFADAIEGDGSEFAGAESGFDAGCNDAFVACSLCTFEELVEWLGFEGLAPAVAF
jgi:hypothetical protein